MGTKSTFLKVLPFKDFLFYSINTENVSEQTDELP